jgi:hypothetical protein
MLQALSLSCLRSVLREEEQEREHIQSKQLPFKRAMEVTHHTFPLSAAQACHSSLEF